VRIAILILSILGAIGSWSMATWTVACASCQGTFAVGSNNVRHSGGHPVEKHSIEEAYETLFLANIFASVGLALQGALILAGGIVSFVHLGKGSSSKGGAMPKSAGLGIGLVDLVVAIVLASQVEKTLLTSNEQILMFYILTAIFTNVLPIISVPLAFMAKPKTVRMIAVANVPPISH